MSDEDDIPDEDVDSDVILSDDQIIQLMCRPPVDGPLAKLIPVFIDFETFMDKSAGIFLGAMTLRQYLASSYVESLAIAIGDDPVQLFYGEDEPNLPEDAVRIDDKLVDALKYLFASPNHVIVAHNNPFDARVARFCLDCPHPTNMWCTMEGAMGTWPELPGGFGLKNVAKRLQLPKSIRKLDMDLSALTILRTKTRKKPMHIKDCREADAQMIVDIAKVGKLKEKGLWDGVTVNPLLINRLMGIYNIRDVECLRGIYKRQVARLPAVEQEISLLTNHQRRFHFQVRQDRLDELLVKLDKNAEYSEARAKEYLTEDQVTEIFNRETDDKSLRSVRHARLKKIVNSSLANEEFTTVSMKKVSPLQLARNPDVRAVLEQTSLVSKMLSHKRRSACFRGVDAIDVELRYMGAHTGRFSSPGAGGAKTLNLHNIPKHQKEVAEPVRKTFLIEKGYVLVRGDLANVEFRVEGYLTGAQRVKKMFDPTLGGNIFNDPYIMSWRDMTGSLIKDKKDPVRQVSKCLGAGSLVAVQRGPHVPIEEVRPDDLVFDGLNWVPHSGVVYSGDKLCVRIESVWFSYDHLILTETGWMEAWQAAYENASTYWPFISYAVLADPNTGMVDGAERWSDLTIAQQQMIGAALESRSKSMPTYDVTNAGPFSRYLAGDMIVHNSAVLGLGFSMSAAGYAKVLLGVTSDPRSGVTEDKLRELIVDSGWPRPQNGALEYIIQKVGCSVVIAMSAFHIHRLFNEAYPEFSMTARWITDTIMAIARCGKGIPGRKSAIEVLKQRYGLPSAPDPNLIGLTIDDDPLPSYPTVRAACGLWVPTVCWREPYMRSNPMDPNAKGPRLTIRKSAGRMGTFKSFSPQLAIENVTQAAARNALCMGLLELKKRGFKDVIHVHDEVMLITPKNRDAILAARQALIEVFGPGHSLPYGWSILIKPDEISVTESMYESELDLEAPNEKNKFLGGDRWRKIEQNTPDCLENLP